MTSIIIIFLLILIVALLTSNFVLSFLKHNSKKNQEDNVDIERVKILLEDNIVEKIDGIIDTYINQAADNFQIFNISPTNVEYTNSEQSDKMSAYIEGMVLKNMTPEVISLLSLTHNINTPDALKEFLRLKIRIYMINFLVQTNDLREE